MSFVTDIEYKLVEIEELGKLLAGTQIAVKSLFQNLHPSLELFYPLLSSEQYYYHHGVYFGDYKVAHFSGQDKTRAKPRECDIFRFSNSAVDGKLYKVEYEDPTQLLPVEETLEKAKVALAKPTEWPGYQIVSNNCESFATWLMTGKERSAQAMGAFGRVIKIVSAAGVVLSAGLAGSSLGFAKLR